MLARHLRGELDFYPRWFWKQHAGPVTCDVNILDERGKRRLRHVARACQDFGQRAQDSVFETEVDPPQCARLKARPEATIRPEPRDQTDPQRQNSDARGGAMPSLQPSSKPGSIPFALA